MPLEELDPLRVLRGINQRVGQFAARRGRNKRYAKAQDWLNRNPGPLKVNVGCGRAPFAGWVNLDSDPRSGADIIWDVSDGLPFTDGTCEFIYSEHFLEHLSVEQGPYFLRECYRSLVTAGVLRIAMPCLMETVRQYYENDWANKPWLAKYGYTWIQTRAEFINICFRHWGHQWLYDAEELHRRLREAGFVHIESMKWGDSRYPELRNRETREETLLIAEAMK